MERDGSSQQSGWLPVLLFLIAFVAATWPTLEGLGARWLKFDEAYSHGFMILAISVWLCVGVWRRVLPQAGFNGFWLAPFLLSAMVYMAGTILLIEAFQQVALLPLLIGGLLILWGWRQTAPFIVPIGLMLFTLPFWDYLSWPLQLITVSVNQFLLSHLDIEFVVEGVFVYFPGVGAFEIAHGCSGLRYLLVGLTLAVFYGELNFNRWRSRILLVLAGIVLALAANWIRVFVIIYQGYESNMTSSLIKEHDFFGWWVFGATLVPLFLYARWLEKREDRSGHVSRPAFQVQPASGARARLAGAAATLVPLAVVCAFSWSQWVSDDAALAREDGRHDTALVDPGQWLPLFSRNLAGWSPTILRPDRARERTYMEREGLSDDGSAADTGLFVGLYSYDYQRVGSELVQWGNRLYDSSSLLPERTFSVDGGDGVELAGLTLRYRQSDVRIHLVYGYYVEGRWETNDLQAKLAQLPGIFNARTDASLLVMAINCQDCDAEARLQALAPGIREEAARYLDQLYQDNRSQPAAP